MKKFDINRTRNQIQKGQNLSCKKGHNTAIINKEKREHYISPCRSNKAPGQYEEKNEKEISTIPSVNDLLAQPWQNETSEDEIMHDQVGQNEFENSDDDQTMQEDDLYYTSVRDRSRSPREINTGERHGGQSNPENETITRSTRPTRGIRPIRFREM